MGPIGWPELIILLVVVLIVFGPGKLPDIGNAIGRGVREFRKASNDFKRTIEDELEAEKTKESQPAPTPAPEATPPVSDVGATDATTAAVPEAAPVTEAAAVPDVAAAPVPTFEGADTSGTPESEPRVERPAEPVVSRDRSADES